MALERRQQNIQAWKNEHRYPTLPGVASAEVSQSLLRVFDFTQEAGISLGHRALDIGCGKGRNALELARRDFSVAAFDISQEAVTTLQQRAQAQGLHIDARIGAMDEPWPYPDNSFDFIVDDTASMSIGHLPGIAVCRDETFRVLAPGGYVAVTSLVNTDGFLLRFPPGEEPGTIVTPDGKVEKLYSPEELREFYAQFRVIFQNLRSKHMKYPNGEEWDRQTMLTILQKPPDEMTL
jgi:ubiquinone/menaquinone biosynthesis C-methylase UbiE